MNLNEKIRNSLWIIASAIMFFNGLGFVYIGSKTGNENWIKEGCIYEIPWILSFIDIGLTSGYFVKYTVVLGMLLLVVSIIRAAMVNPKYHEALEHKNYRKSKNEGVSLLFFVLSVIPAINGIPMIIHGILKPSRNQITEGIIYEIPWVLYFIIPLNSFLSKILVSISIISTLVSAARAIMVNYEIGSLSETVSVKNRTPNIAKTPKVKVPHVENETEETSDDEKSPYSDRLPEIHSLSKEFKCKEKKVLKLIEKRFKSSEITYEKFKSVITNAHENFYIQKNSALEIIDLSSNESEKITGELSKRIDAMKSILEKVNQLIEALVIDSVESKETEKDLKVLVGDMEELIDSVKDYN